MPERQVHHLACADARCRQGVPKRVGGLKITRDAMSLTKQIMREHPLSRATAELTALQ